MVSRSRTAVLLRFLATGMLPVLAALFFLGEVSLSQMPDWTMIRDRDGNKFYMDRNGKIWTSGEPDFRYRPVSIEGLDYYLHQAVALIKNRHMEEGLTLLKSIMALPSGNAAIYDAQVKASREINRLIKKEGIRYRAFNAKAALLLYREGGRLTIVNDRMPCSVRLPASSDILRFRVRENERYGHHGLLVGVNLKEGGAVRNGEFRRFDLLLAMDGERFRSPVGHLRKLEEHWRQVLGPDTFAREVLEEKEDRIVYRFRDRGSPAYAGYEGFFLNGNLGFCVRIISDGAGFPARADEMRSIMESFRLQP
jgi:hypothetical protein